MVVEMLAQQLETDRLVRQPMSYADDLQLPEGVRAEYVDGIAIVTPPATRGHNRVQRRLASHLESRLDPSLDVATEAGWGGDDRVRIPDIAVFAEHVDVSIDDQVPIMVVEVLSPSTRSEDTLRKSTDYLAAGIGQYWILDREHRLLTVLEGRGDRWALVVELDDRRPRGEVRVADHGVVPLDLTLLLGAPTD